MKNIYNIEAVLKEFPNIFNPDKWSVIIPAAGKGTRLNYHKEKILYPIAGKTILEWQLNFLRPFFKNFIYILSPKGKKEIEPHLEKLIAKKYQIIIQNPPLGMGDAVFQTKKHIHTPYVFIIWGDQICLDEKIIKAGLILHENRTNPILTLPTFTKIKPYIHFERTDNNKLLKVLQKREGDLLPQKGESDCGMFYFSTKELFYELSLKKKNFNHLGNKTKEFNFLPLFPKFDNQPGNVCTLKLPQTDHIIGINTTDDAQKAEKYFITKNSI